MTSDRFQSDPPMHCRRTLDQFGYPSLHSTEARDRDQVLHKYNKSLKGKKIKVTGRARRRLTQQSAESSDNSEDSDEEGETESPQAVLMVDTLWLWILADDTILTFAPKRECADEETSEYSSHADLVEHIKRSMTEERNNVKDPFDFAALIICCCIDALLRGSTESNLRVFHVFESHASDLIERQTQASRSFKDELYDKRETGTWKLSRAFDTYSVHPQGYIGKDSDHGDDFTNLLELRDIADELNTIKSLLNQQLEQVKQMIKQYRTIWKSCRRGYHGKEFLQEGQRRIERYKRQIESLESSCQQAIGDYKDLLNLKETHSGVEEARTASEQARTVTIFTVITIIFSPLSFLASIFGMNVSDWSGTPQNPDLRDALKIILSTSFSVIAVLLLLAFNRIVRRAVHAITNALMSKYFIILVLLRIRLWVYRVSLGIYGLARWTKDLLKLRLWKSKEQGSLDEELGTTEGTIGSRANVSTVVSKERVMRHIQRKRSCP